MIEQEYKQQLVQKLKNQGKKERVIRKCIKIIMDIQKTFKQFGIDLPLPDTCVDEKDDDIEYYWKNFNGYYMLVNYNYKDTVVMFCSYEQNQLTSLDKIMELSDIRRLLKEWLELIFVVKLLKATITDLAIYDLDEPIKLSSGVETKRYFNIKNIMMVPDIAASFARIIDEFVVQRYFIDCVGGVATGAIPIVQTVSLYSHVDGFYYRKDAKPHGLQNVLEGVEPHGNILLVEDVITTGASVNQLIEYLNDQGYKHIQVFAIVSRREYDCLSLFKETDFIQKE